MNLPQRLYEEPEVSRCASKWDNEQLELGNAPIKFAYDPNKGKAMVKYLLRELGGDYNYMALLKIAFFADRYHVRTFGRTVSTDEYYAMKLGPVPSNLLRLIQKFPGDGYDLQLATDAIIEMDEFSQSDIEAMQFALVNFGDIGLKNPFILADLTHAYPEWDQWRDRFEQNPEGREEIDFAKFLENADPAHEVFHRLEFVDPFPKLSEADRELMALQMREFGG